MRACLKRRRKEFRVLRGTEESGFSENHSFHLEGWDKVWEWMVATAGARCQCLQGHRNSHLQTVKMQICSFVSIENIIHFKNSTGQSIGHLHYKNVDPHGWGREELGDMKVISPRETRGRPGDMGRERGPWSWTWFSCPADRAGTLQTPISTKLPTKGTVS